MIPYAPLNMLVIRVLRCTVWLKPIHEMPTKIRKSGQEVAKQKKGFAKNDVRYWEGAVFKPWFTRGGERVETKQFSVRINHQGKRQTIPLGLANKTEAGRRAREIYLALITGGWEAMLEKFHPNHVHPQRPEREEQDKPPSVGEYIELASKMAGVAPRTIAGYVTSLRMIAAAVARIKVGSSKFDYRKGGRDAWVSKVDAVSLDALTPSSIEEWKHRFIKARKGNPVEERKAKNSVNSFIRQARSLFSPKMVKLVGETFRLPEPLPFKDVSLFPRSSMRYVSRIDIREIVAAAYQELGAARGEGEKPDGYESRIEQFKIFLLAAFAGLRRNEIDKLLWSQVDLKNGTIEIRETAHFKPKSEESNGTIEIEPEVAALLSQYNQSSKETFVIRATSGKARSKSPQWYRAERHFGELLAWLKRHGVDDLKPLHVLRKEAGSMVNGTMGLYAASRFRRHGDVRVTAEHYLDKTSAATVGMGSLLRTEKSLEDE